jgi:hypothetical protein
MRKNVFLMNFWALISNMFPELLSKAKYDEFKWKLCADIKVVALLVGM